MVGGALGIFVSVASKGVSIERLEGVLNTECAEYTEKREGIAVEPLTADMDFFLSFWLFF